MRKILLAFILTLALPLSAQQVVPAWEYEWQFDRKSGWTGADGTYSYLLSDGTTLWSFSDTFFGEVTDDGKRGEFEFVNNSHVIQRGDELGFLEPPSFTPPDRKGWFWMWDGIYDREFQVLLGQFEQSAGGVFGFRQIGLWYARARIYPRRLVVTEYIKLPFFDRRDQQQITYGSAVYREGAWDYVLGIRDDGPQRSATLARVPVGRMGIPGVWRFFDGTSWGEDPWRAKPLFAGASMESSLHRTRDGGYLYVGSPATDGRIVARYAASLTGPWGEPSLIFQAPQARGDVFVYNAKAHPHLSVQDRLLISYNVNTADLQKVVEEADIYRPRFVWWTPEDPGWLP